MKLREVRKAMVSVAVLASTLTLGAGRADAATCTVSGSSGALRFLSLGNGAHVVLAAGYMSGSGCVAGALEVTVIPGTGVASTCATQWTGGSANCVAPLDGGTAGVLFGDQVRVIAVATGVSSTGDTSVAKGDCTQRIPSGGYTICPLFSFA